MRGIVVDFAARQFVMALAVCCWVDPREQEGASH